MSASDWDGLLEDGEEIIWQGQPSPALRWEFESPFQAFFYVLWGGIPLAALFGDNNLGGLLALVPLAFVTFALYMLIGQHLHKAYQRRHTFYTLTDRRAFIGKKRTFAGRTLDIYPISAEAPITLQEGRFDTVFFAENVGEDSDGNVKRVKIGFEMLNDGREVLGRLRDVQRALA